MAARAAQERVGGPAGHMAVFCNAAPGCRSVWYRPRHDPGGEDFRPRGPGLVVDCLGQRRRELVDRVALRVGEVLAGQLGALVGAHDATAIPVGAAGSGSVPLPRQRRHGPPSGLVRSPTQATQIGSCGGVLVVGTVSVMAGPPVSGLAPPWFLPWRGRLSHACHRPARTLLDSTAGDGICDALACEKTDHAGLANTARKRRASDTL
jgi:hypothetical protein